MDYRLLAARGYAPASAGDDVPVDLVFVDDLVLPVFIGAYARERDAPQNVRFAVTASVMRAGRAAEDMRDVFSYDLITDGIRLLIGAGHIPLVETLAERIAAMVLGHPRVTKVMVRVEKLETGSGTVGVEIERTRTAARNSERPRPVPADGRGVGQVVTQRPDRGEARRQPRAVAAAPRLACGDPPNRRAGRGGARRRTVRRCRPDGTACDGVRRRSRARYGLDGDGAVRTRTDRTCRVGSSMPIRSMPCEDAMVRGDVPVWSPWPMLRAHPEIPRSWEVTSDSLAVWLAATLDARRRGVDQASRARRRPADHDLLDAAFPRFAARFGGVVRIAGPDDLAAADALFGGQTAAAA